ncbi:MAG TPA: SGNH hydrolase domain-containing protein, partial [Candidatus Limnocylindria bacterium]|nr:SGNH hydrolase domain-containing protein [Candidatus Limnocylindria bacterium]
EARPPDCVFGVTDGPVTVALMGDSHAGQWLPAIEALAAERGWRILPMVKGNCPVVDVTVWHERLQRVYHECDQFRELAIEKLQREGAAIVFIGMTRTYEVVDEDGGRQPIDAIADDWRDGMARALRGIDAVAGRVVLLADTPRHAESPVRCLSRESLVEHCQMERSALVDDEYAAVEAAAARQAGVELVAVDDWLCDTSRCPLVVGDYFVYRDTNHLTASYVADVLAPRLAAVLDGASPAP